MILFFVLHAANLAALHWRHYQTFGHLAPLGLHADHILTEPELEGAPHVNMHTVQLANFGLLPRRFRACHTLSDAMNSVLYLEIVPEQWESNRKVWKAVSEYQDRKFCKAIPMTHFDGEIRSDWLLPGQQLRQTAGVLLQHDPFSNSLTFRLMMRIDPDDPTAGGIPTEGFQVERSTPRL